MLVRTDPGENARYSENDLINHVPDNNIDEKVWSQVKDELKQNKKMKLNAIVRIQIEQLEQNYPIIFLKILEKILQVKY